MTKVINLFAGPGAGKSTTAAGLFNAMKLRGLSCELVTEYAKELTYDGAPMDNQLVMLAEQDRRLARLCDQVDYVITDSPLPLGLAYATGFWTEPAFTQLVWSMFYRYRNHCFTIRRVKPYSEIGRNQSEEEAKALDVVIERLAKTAALGEPVVVDGDANAPTIILSHLGLL